MKNFAGNISSIESKAKYIKSLGEDDFGEFTLGINTSKIMHQDPKLLLFTQSRYKFVSKMFGGFDKVLEIGCQEGFGATIVGQVVNHLVGIDFYIPHIESCRRRIRSPKLSFEARDVLNGPIPGGFQGIFALDVLEHIESQHEDSFMKNICNSFADDSGVLVLGMPSLESQIYASEASKIGHVNCKSGSEFSKFSKKYFKNVFSFSMNDEVLHTGFAPMSHYLFVVCTQPKVL